MVTRATAMTFVCLNFRMLAKNDMAGLLKELDLATCLRNEGDDEREDVDAVLLLVAHHIRLGDNGAGARGVVPPTRLLVPSPSKIELRRSLREEALLIRSALELIAGRTL